MLGNITSSLQIAGMLIGLGLILYNVFTGVTVREVGIPGVVTVGFGSGNPAPSTSIAPPQSSNPAQPPAKPAPPSSGSTSTNAASARLQSLTMEAPTASFANPAQARVTLSGPAPFPGARISLRTADATVATVPDFTIILAGDTSATFRITAKSSGPPQGKSQPATATVIASYMGQEQTATVTVQR